MVGTVRNVDRIESVDSRKAYRRCETRRIEKVESYVFLFKSQISMVLTVRQKNMVGDFGDQIASKKAREFEEENTIDD